MQKNNSGIQLFNESGWEIPLDLPAIENIASLLSEHESCSFAFLEVVYVDEAEIVHINKEHLERNYVTDIISFRYDENENNAEIEGTLFCCAPRIYEQDLDHGKDSEKEFKRILIHGLLHLCGYEDNSPKAKEKMTHRENFYLDKLY